MSLTGLHILRRIEERGTLSALRDDCAGVLGFDLRILELARDGLIECEFRITPAGIAALEAEPKHHRDQPGLTNR